MFCPNCGFNSQDSNFCPSCGNNLKQVSVQSPQTQSQQPQMFQPQPTSDEEVVLWTGKPSSIMDKAKGGLNKVEYKITNQRIIISSGLIGRKETEIEFRHIKDFKVNQTLTDRMSNVGDIFIISSDMTEGNFELKNVPDPLKVKEIIRKSLNDYRARMNIIYRENV